jgi:hypothetical protein
MMASVIIISWSDNPGMFVDDFTSVALVANTISNKLFSLVGVSCTWVRLNSVDDIIITDAIIKPTYNKIKPQKCCLHSKANWDKIDNEIAKICVEIDQMGKTKLISTLSGKHSSES